MEVAFQAYLNKLKLRNLQPGCDSLHFKAKDLQEKVLANGRTAGYEQCLSLSKYFHVPYPSDYVENPY